VIELISFSHLVARLSFRSENVIFYRTFSSENMWYLLIGHLVIELILFSHLVARLSFRSENVIFYRTFSRENVW